MDGNTSSYWDCGDRIQDGETVSDTWNRLANNPADRPWLTVDLGAIYDITKVNIVTYVSTGRYYQYEIYLSTDNETWVLAGEKKDTAEPVAAGVDHPVCGMYARYVKVVGTYHSRNTSFHIAELRVYGKLKEGTFRTGWDTLQNSLSDLREGYNRYNYTAESAAAFDSAAAYAERALTSLRSCDFALTTAHHFLQQAAEGLTYEFKLQSAALLLGKDINIVYTAVVPDGYEDVYILFECNGKQTKVVGTDNGDNTYSFLYCDILPQQFSDNIRATLCATRQGETVTCVKETYSVREYCEYQLTHSEDDPLITLLSDLLIYGEKAQIVSGYKTDSLVTEGLSLSPSVFETLGDAYNKASLAGEESSLVSWRGAGLRLEHPLALYLNFYCENPEAVTVTVQINGRVQHYDAGDFVERDGYYRIYLRGIAAAEFNEEITAVFSVDGVQTGQELHYSVNSYIYAKQNDPSDMLDLLKAVYNYGASVSAYSGKTGE